MFWNSTWEWPDGHRLEPYGSGDFRAVCPTQGPFVWMPQTLGERMITMGAECSCGAVLDTPPREIKPPGTAQSAG